MAGEIQLIAKVIPKNAAFIGIVDASQALVDTATFNTNLTAADDTVQKALEKLDDVVGEKGDKGDTGLTGDKGDKGDKGDTGDSGSIVIFNAQVGTTYTLVLTDVGKIITLTNALAIAVTIPTNALVAFPTGTRIDLIQNGAGKVTFSGAGVTIKSKSSNKSIAAQNVAVALVKEATDTWYLIGDLIA